MTPTALHEKFTSTAKRLAEYGGAQTAAAFSSLEAELRALNEGCGVFDLGWRAKLLITGADRTRWLNGMISNNIRDLAPGHGVYSFFLNPQGHILGDMYVYNRGESMVLDTDVAQVESIASKLKRYIIMDKVEIDDASQTLSAIGLQGPKSLEVLRAAGSAVPDLAALQIQDSAWGDNKVPVVRTLYGGYEVWAGAGNAARIWESLLSVGAAPVGSEALEVWRITKGIPRYEQDIRERDLPQETGQEQALSFTKGCYIGQEIVERIRSRGAVHRMLTGFCLHGTPPAPGTKIEKDGREVGEITSVTTAPGLGAIGLGYIRREAGGPGTKLDIGGTEATVTELPFASNRELRTDN
jgi:folate-binding protein YgfZ